ncbi:MAG: hypothetical protein SGILL_009121 [Bacillariaceae sp.]
MPSSSSYKLHSAGPTACGEKPVCAFFQSAAGCRNGDNCKFLHTASSASSGKKESSAEISEVSSVVSSESEGSHQARQSASKKNTKKQQQQSAESSPDDNPFADTNQPQKKGNDQSNKKKKRKPSDNKDPFSGSKTNIPQGETNDLVQPPSKKTKKAKTPKQQNAKVAAPTSDFRSFVSNLPVASFSIPELSNKSTPAKKKEDSSRKTPSRKPSGNASADSDDAAPKQKETQPSARRVVPTTPVVTRKWGKAINRSRQHERYDGDHNYPKYREMNLSNGIKDDWIQAKPHGPWCQNNPQAIAIDCEMCETQDPLSGAKNHKALCRISVVNADKPEEVLLDTLVKPQWPVTDYRTRINGVTKEHLDPVEFTLRHAQAFMMALCSEETVVVGHAVHNDLVALHMDHDVVADSSYLYEASDSTSASVSLKDIVKKVLNSEMPKTHDSVNDARKALECVLYWVDRDGKVEAVERTPKFSSNANGNQLFVHRVPKQCKKEHMFSMFLNHTTIQPIEVEDIAFPGNTGKTHVTFKSAAHADLAFDSIDGKAEEELSGRLQKKVYLRNGDYVRIRKMVRPKRSSLSNTPSAKDEGKERNNQRTPEKKEQSYAPFAGSFRDMEFTTPPWMKEQNKK